MQFAVTTPLSSGLVGNPNQMHMQPQKQQQQLHMPAANQQPAAPPEGSPFSVLLGFANAEALAVSRDSCLQLVHAHAAVTARAARAPVAELLPLDHLPPHVSNLTTGTAQVFWLFRTDCGSALFSACTSAQRSRF